MRQALRDNQVQFGTIAIAPQTAMERIEHGLAETPDADAMITRACGLRT